MGDSLLTSNIAPSIHSGIRQVLAINTNHLNTTSCPFLCYITRLRSYLEREPKRLGQAVVLMSCSCGEILQLFAMVGMPCRFRRLTCPSYKIYSLYAEFSCFCLEVWKRILLVIQAEPSACSHRSYARPYCTVLYVQYNAESVNPVLVQPWFTVTKFNLMRHLRFTMYKILVFIHSIPHSRFQGSENLN